MTGRMRNENQFTKLLTFAPEEGDQWEDWEEYQGAWRHKAVPVYRKPQDEWDAATDFEPRWIYFRSKTVKDDPEPADLDLPTWLTCFWDSQAGRWVLLAPGSSPGGSGASIQGVFLESSISEEGHNLGKRVATVSVRLATCGRDDLLPDVEFTDGEIDPTYVEVEVTDHSGCVFDHDDEDLAGVWVWASEMRTINASYDPRETIPDPEDPEGPEIENPGYDPEKYGPCHWVADDRCCVDADYPPPEEEE